MIGYFLAQRKSIVVALGSFFKPTAQRLFKYRCAVG